MTFNDIWKKMISKYGSENEPDIETWKERLGHFRMDILNKSVEYFFDKLDKDIWPELETIANIYIRLYEHEKSVGPEREAQKYAEKHGLPYPADTEEKAEIWKRHTQKEHGESMFSVITEPKQEPEDDLPF